MYNLGVLDFGIGDFEEAARMHRRAVAGWERAVGPNHPYVAWGLSGLADSLASLGRPREAVRYYERALSIRERTLGPRHTRVARTLTNLSKNLARLGATARADALSARAVSIWEDAKSPDGLTEALLVRARVESQKGRPDLARASYERVIALRLPLFGAAHPTIAEAEAGLAETLAALGHPADARAAALRAERIGRDHLRLTVGALSERQALAYAASRPRGLDLALSLIADEGSATEVYDDLIRSRALVLDEMATRQRLRADASATPALGTLWNELTSARQKLANLAVRGPADESGQRYAAELDAARREKERLEAALAESSAAVRQELTRTEVGLPDVLASVPARSAVVSFVRYDRAPRSTPAYMAFVLRSGEAGPAPVSLGPAAAIEHAVALWRKDVPSGLRDDGTMIATAEASLRVLGESLRRKVWAPLAPLLTDVDHVFVVPEADLNLVPFAALPAGRTGYLIDGAVRDSLPLRRTRSRRLHDEGTGCGSRLAGPGRSGLRGDEAGGTDPIDRSWRQRDADRPCPAPVPHAPVDLVRRAASRGTRSPGDRRTVAAASPGRGVRRCARRYLIGSAATEAAFKRAGAGRRIPTWPHTASSWSLSARQRAPHQGRRGRRAPRSGGPGSCRPWREVPSCSPDSRWREPIAGTELSGASTTGS